MTAERTEDRRARTSPAPVVVPLLLTLALVLALAPDASARPWDEMDRGPFLTASVESSAVGGQRDMTPKGVVVRVNPGASPPAYVMFDEDLLRYSAAWTGPVFDWRGVVFDGSHQTWPRVVGEQAFGTRSAPGWAFRGAFDDPRARHPSTDYKPQPEHWRNRAYGPLPRERARYKGLYLHGQRVIFSYAVEGVDVLDSPGMADGLFTRTLNVARAPQGASDLIVRVVDHPDEAPARLLAAADLKPAASSSAEGTIAVLGASALGPRPAEAAAAAAAATMQAGGKPVAGLVARWSFDPAKAAVTASDARFAGQVVGDAQSSAERGGSLVLKAGAHVLVRGGAGIDTSKDFSVAAWVRTRAGGTIFSKTTAGEWVPHGKTFFIERGSLMFDVGWVGAVRGSTRVSDGAWHHVAMTYAAADGAVRLFVDGEADGAGKLRPTADVAGSAVRLGLTSADFPRGDGNRMDGALAEVQFYGRALSAAEVAALAGPRAKVGSARAVAVAAVGAKGLAWETSAAGQLRLRIPAAATPAKVTLRIAAVGAEADLKALAGGPAGAAAPAPDDLARLTSGGPGRWPQALETRGTLGREDGPYAVDRLVAPEANPWKALMRFSGFDFFKDGRRAAICTWDGDVFIASGIDEKLEKLTWRRYATGLFQPLGLKVVADEQGREQVYVCCRDQIVRLHDLNADGEADLYECFNGDHEVTEHFHEFAMGLDTDAEGNFYYAKAARHALDAVVPQHGTILKVSRDGSRTEVVAHGFRAPNGMAVGPKGEIATTDQEGYWMPANRINLVRPGSFHGNMWSYAGRGRKESQGYDVPVVWMPPPVDRSPAEVIWVASDRWGLPRGSLLDISYGMGKVLHVMAEEVEGVPQGGVYPIPGLTFGTGVMRGRFHPGDGQLYVCGLVGWSTNTAEPGGFYRVRRTDRPLRMPVALHVKKDGLLLRFSEPLDKRSAGDPDNYSVRQWNYRWTKNYGSQQYSVEEPTQVGQDDVEVESATVSADGREVFLKIEDLAPVMQMRIDLSLRAADGGQVKHTIHSTINKAPG